MANVTYDHVSKEFGNVVAVNDMSIEVPDKEFLVFVGPSGCGKTTAGKAILQLLDATAGRVRFEDVELTALRGEALRSRRRDFQIIFQDPFSSMNPRMSVGDIIEEGMTAQRIGGAAPQRRQRVQQLLEQVGLEKLADRQIGKLSGGQVQRVLGDKPAKAGKDLRLTLDLPLQQAAEKALDAGVVVVCSAGNYGRDGNFTVTSPGNSPRVITVGSITDKGTGLVRASRGSNPWFAA